MGQMNVKHIHDNVEIMQVSHKHNHSNQAHRSELEKQSDHHASETQA
jgi:hypothetical protein